MCQTTQRKNLLIEDLLVAAHARLTVTRVRRSGGLTTVPLLSSSTLTFVYFDQFLRAKKRNINNFHRKSPVWPFVNVERNAGIPAAVWSDQSGRARGGLLIRWIFEN